MTVEDMKKFDKRLREIQDPIGLGFPTLRKTFVETAEKFEMSLTDLILQYSAWKWKK